MRTLSDGSVVYDSFEEISEAQPIGLESTRYESVFVADPSDPTNPVREEYKVVTSCWGYTYNGKYWRPNTNEWRVKITQKEDNNEE